MKIGFIGGGAMAEAIVCGITSQNLLPEKNVFVSDHKASRCEYLKNKYNINAYVGSDNFIKNVDVLILAIKPQTAKKAIDEIKNTVNPTTMIISIVTGLTLSVLEKSFPQNPVVRVMPNTPMAVGAGMSAISLGSHVNETNSVTAEKIFAAAGAAIIVEEKLMDAVAGLSGSGPAFIFIIIDALSDAGVKAGLKRDAAIKLAAQTVLGSAKMVLETGLHPAQLRDQVTSPGGTTIEGVQVMEEHGVRGALIDTVTAAVAKSRSMGKI
ncbi:pyrroline-5-carboxylate reductase [Pectinatus frisingensis]|uniref:pyrroline-5-carboxylate reductase n=1 Tax=Pectinatus frisingensis TaxID=865 RepID=UPI0015F51873|nr:pyrroline-5-carboxylate reductase [Pectinatus frisingensis]